MSLYEYLVKNNLIESEKYTYGPTRVRQKTMGFMWEAKIEVHLKNKKRCRFYMWNHFYDDDGSVDWRPTDADVRKYMHCKFAPFDENKLFDACWHMVLCDGKYYVSQKGWFGYENKNNFRKIIQSIKNGTWKEDPDIALIC